jgi:hypothetical protein
MARVLPGRHSHEARRRSIEYFQGGIPVFALPMLDEEAADMSAAAAAPRL